MPTIVGAFDDLCLAQRAVADLIGSGFPRNVISVLIRQLQRPARTAEINGPRGGPAVGSVLAGGPLGEALRLTDHDESAVAVALTRAGLPPSAAQFFAEAVTAGSILVTVHCKDDAVRDARDILDIYAAPEPDLNQRAGTRGAREDPRLSASSKSGVMRS